MKSLIKQVESQSVIIKELQQENADFKALIRQLNNRIFGVKADRIEDSQQPDVLNEAEAGIDQQPVVGEPCKVTSKGAKRGGRRKLPQSLPRTIIMHDLPEAEKQCGECKQPMTVIDVDSTEKLKYIPATVEVEVHQRPKYGCKHCECAPQQAKPAAQAIPKSMATSSLLAHVLISKFMDATPLYRQQQQWARLDIDLGRALLSSWVMKCGEVLSCLWDLAKEDLQLADYVQADETTLQVLHEEKRTAIQKSYMWLFQSGPPGKRIILYHYAASRASHVPSDMLGALFRGYLQTDGYAGYRAIYLRDGVTGLGCFAHARRKFVDAAKLHKTQGLAHEAVGMIQRLYAVEKKAKIRLENDENFTFDDRKALRLEESKPILDELKQWLDQHQDSVLPKSAIGKAMAYTRNEWLRLVVYLEDGRLEIDNNAAERSIKPFVIGRKNWLFCNTAAGAKTSAVVYSLLQSAKANNLPIIQWLTYVLDKLPRCTNNEQRCALLPHRFDIKHLENRILAI
ncbi:MAG: IS66 family transposase [Ghiorsea sp.]